MSDRHSVLAGQSHTCTIPLRSYPDTALPCLHYGIRTAAAATAPCLHLHMYTYRPTHQRSIGTFVCAAAAALAAWCFVPPCAFTASAACFATSCGALPALMAVLAAALPAASATWCFAQCCSLHCNICVFRNFMWMLALYNGSFVRCFSG